MKKRFFTLVCLLLVTTVLFALLGGYLKFKILAPLGMYQEESLIAVPFMLLADDTAQFAISRMIEEKNAPAAISPPETESEPLSPTSVPTEAATEAATEPPTLPPTEPPTEPIVITEDWFNDVLFIGDSRTVGMRDMARLGEADYFCAGSMSLFMVTNSACSDRDFYNKSLNFVLTNFSYGKIYIHLGLNECGSEPDLIIEKYQEVIDLIREKQPDAAIILQSVMSVTEIKATNPNFATERIYALNERIEQLAQDNGLFYQETNDFAADEEGYLRGDIAYDGAHPNSLGYELWAQFIMEQAQELGIR